MHIEQIYTGCLAQGAYFISSKDEAVVIDPLREVDNYIEKANKEGVKIKYIFETHFHADFVSGHIDLANKTGATIVYGPTEMQLGFDAHIAQDGEQFKVGDITFNLIHTPGHTMESSCFLLLDENNQEHSIYTGDTLFIGDVGRPDLAQKVSKDLTQEKLAKHLFYSLRNKIMPLADNITVYPAHGAGSACGKNMSKETSDTLGHQKRTNYALNPELSEEQFIKEVTDGLTPPPAYFPENVMMNIKGYESLDNIIKKGLTKFSPEEFENTANNSNAIILDTRNQQVFKEGHIPNSIFIGINGGFAPWVGTLIKDIKQPILIVADEGMEQEVITRLSRVGYDNSIGYLKGGFDTWKNANKEIAKIESISAEEFSNRLEKDNYEVLDVRKTSEYNNKHIFDAINTPLDYINENMDYINKEKSYFVHCAGGYRSMIFISILKARGYDKLIDIKGGFNAIAKTDSFNLVEAEVA